MENLSIRYVFDRKQEASNEKKTGLLQIEVRLNRTSKKIFISTGIRLYKNQFSDKNGFTCRNHNNSVLITGKAVRIFRQIEAFVLSDKCNSLKDVKNWDINESDGYSVVEFMKSELKKSDPSHATWEHHTALIRQIEAFGKIKVFSDIKYQNISDFDFWLKKNGVKMGSTLQKRHSTFRRYIKKAIYMDLCKKDPYFEFRMPSKKGKDPIFLLESEIGQILNYKPISEKLQHVKDMFVFQIFTGLAYVDLAKFDRSCIFEVDGDKVMRSKREKTDESFVSLLLPEAETILKRYDYRLPIMTNQKYNDYLKLLGAGSGLTKKLTSHVARHTFATYLLNKGVSISSVSKAMGHSNIKMTEHYAKLLGKTVIEEMKRVK